MEKAEVEKQWAEAVEQARKNYFEHYRKDSIVVGGVCVSVILVIFVLSWRNGGLNLFWAFFIGIFGYLIVYVRNLGLYRTFELTYKQFFVFGMLKKVFPGCQYYHGKGISRTEIEEIGMMDTGDRFSSEDLVVGKYNGVGFKQADLTVKREYKDSDGNEHYTTIFKGRYVIFDIKKKFDFRMAVIGKRFGAGELKNRDKMKKFRRRTMESGEFNKRFKVYAEDGFEAFYLLDPAILERIERLGERYKDRVAIFFYRGFMHVAIKDYSDAFEVPKASKPIDEAGEVEKIRRDVVVLTDLVDGLKLVGE